MKSTDYINGKLDRRSLRIAAVWRLFVCSKRIDEKQATELLAQVGIGRNLLVHWKTTRIYRENLEDC